MPRGPRGPMGAMRAARGGGMGRMRGGIMFLQTCLLVLLRREKSYGYSLANDLAQFGFNPQTLDISIIYRALRELETEGLVSAGWDEKSMGPQRRMYEITPQGLEVLALSMAELGNRKREIEALEHIYQQATNKNPS